MTQSYKKWNSLGLVAMMAVAMLVSCGGEAGDGGEIGEASTADVTATEVSIALGKMGEGESGEASHSMDMLPVEKRVAFMSGHVQAGLVLFRAGAPDQAAEHLLHPVSETHEAERGGIDALGFKQNIFLGVSAALEAGLPASEVEPQLRAAEANMALMQINAGGDQADIIAYLMDTVLEEYRIGVTDGIITDAGEYQDAYGFTVVALGIASRIEGENSASLTNELEALFELWPVEGPLAASTPTAVAKVVAQASKVHIALSDLKE